MFGKLIFLTALAVATAEWPSTCSSEYQLLPHETDCTQFYYCVNGDKSVPRSCAPGTAFSFEKQECDHPENVQCLYKYKTSSRDHIEFLPNGCPSDYHIYHLLPHEADCTKFYYCNFGGKIERNCAPGTAFNYDIQVCDWPHNVNCEAHEHEIEHENEHGNEHEHGYENEHGNENENEHENKHENEHDHAENSESESEETNNNKSYEVLENGCPVDWNIHLLVANEHVCNKFYYCVHGNLVEMSCAPGTVFNAELQVCDWPHNVNCDNKIIEVSEEQHSESEEQHHESHEERDEEDPKSIEHFQTDGWLDNGCPADPSIHYLVADEHQCGKFYYCVNGQLVSENCQHGLVFNPVAQTCDWPENYHCNNEETSGNHENEHENHETEHENHTESHENHTESNENHTQANDNHVESNENRVESVETNAESCPLDWDPNVLIADEADCSKFYYCIHGQLLERECASGTLFNPDTQVCDWPHNVNCDNKIVEVSEEQHSESEEHHHESHEERDEEDSKSIEHIETEGWLNNGCPADPSIHYLVADEHNCGKFYYCVNGQLVTESCQHGLVFNPVAQTCDWPENYHCNNEETSGNHETEHEHHTDSDENHTESHENHTESHEIHTESHENHSESHENHSESNESRDESVETNAESCPLDWDPNVLIADEADCSKFYYCIHGQLLERECAAGTLFNPDTQTCDWPANVACAQPNHARCADCNIAPWAHHTCGKFWRCHKDQAVLVTCSDGLHFNSNTLTCDFAEKAGCSL